MCILSHNVYYYISVLVIVNKLIVNMPKREISS